ncbi:hypothetical protein niasHS_008504 [Heterodera schachtii]|uniref:G-protein coupled receptors family 1 profile domain-containing protein n=1 Tax=Heterodera schachtii TaxID=97005 RepID=A0ABD2JF25_HETSC
MVPLNATEAPQNQQLTYVELSHQNGDQHTLAMWLIMGEKCVLSSIGILFNAILVATTVKSNKLHNTCNVLFALDSLFLALFQMNSLITLLIAAFGINFVPNSTCFYFQAVPLFSVLMSFCLMFQIGLERLANVLFPICRLYREEINAFLESIGIRMSIGTQQQQQQQQQHTNAIALNVVTRNNNWTHN